MNKEFWIATEVIAGQFSHRWKEIWLARDVVLLTNIKNTVYRGYEKLETFPKNRNYKENVSKNQKVIVENFGRYNLKRMLAGYTEDKSSRVTDSTVLCKQGVEPISAKNNENL